MYNNIPISLYKKQTVPIYKIVFSIFETVESLWEWFESTLYIHLSICA